MAVVQHPDFPNSAMGIHGLNPWNVLLANITLAWLVARKHEGLRWDLPAQLNVYLAIFFAVIIVSYLRMVSDLETINKFALLRNEEVRSQVFMFSEYIINCFKWIIPGILLYDGCRNEQRFRLATYSIVGMYFFLAIQVIKWMPISVIVSGDDGLSARALKIIENEIGYHRVNMAMLLAGAAWALYTIKDLPNSRLGRQALVAMSAFTVLALAMTGGRMGFATWVFLAIVFAYWRWRRLLVVGPLIIAIVLAVVPAARDRLLQGFGDREITTNSAIESTLYTDGAGPHWYTVTSGRSVAWPHVVNKITEAPFLGFGRKAMQNTGLSATLAVEYGEAFPHPHNAYLQWTLDNGLLAMIPVLILFFLIVRQAKRLFLDDDDPVYVAAGGLCLALVLAFLVAAVGSQSFYPREGAVGMWCAIFLMWRVARQRQLVIASERIAPAQLPVGAGLPAMGTARVPPHPG